MRSICRENVSSHIPDQIRANTLRKTAKDLSSNNSIHQYGVKCRCYFYFHQTRSAPSMYLFSLSLLTLLHKFGYPLHRHPQRLKVDIRLEILFHKLPPNHP